MPTEAPDPTLTTERPEGPGSPAVLPADPTPVAAARAPWWADRRVQAAMLVLGLLVAVTAVAAVVGQSGPDEGAVEQAAVEQTAWRNFLRQAPLPLEGGFVAGALATGDGLSPEGRLEDYYAFDFDAADSSAFSVLVTAAGFAPDLVVTTPSGEHVAASTLWQTSRRAEVTGLSGPGRYVIAVTAREAGAGGAYELSASPPPLPHLVEPESVVDSTLGLVGIPRGGRFEDHYAVLAPPDQPVLVAVRARAFRPRLTLLGPEGEVVAPWSSLARVDSDTLHTAVLRYQPGWDAPYRLLVSSEDEEQRGDYTVEVEAVRVLTLRTDGRAVRGTLGESGWYRENHYGDTYRFEVDAGTVAVIEARSSEFLPALVLRQGTRELGRASGGSTVRLSHSFSSSGLFEVDVTSVDTNAVGDYTVAVTADSPEGPRVQSFNTEARRTGTTPRGHSFEVTVRRVSIAPAGAGRVRVRLRVEERSLDFEGEWDDWQARTARTRLTDDTGRTYAPVDASGGQDSSAVVPDGLRRGEITFEGPAAGSRPGTITLLYPIGVGGRVVVAVPVSLQR